MKRFLRVRFSGVRLLAIAVAAALCAPLAIEAAHADGMPEQKIHRAPVRHHHVRHHYRDTGVSFPRYSIASYCRYQARFKSRYDLFRYDTCQQYESDVRRDLGARWSRLPHDVRYACKQAAQSIDDRAYTVLNGCVDELRVPGGIPALLAGRGLFR